MLRWTESTIFEFLDILKATGWVPSEAEDALPKDMTGILALLAAIGHLPACLYCYDMCKLCNHVFRYVGDGGDYVCSQRPGAWGRWRLKTSSTICVIEFIPD